MNDKDHHKAIKSNALTCIYLMPTNCPLNSHSDITISRCLISRILRLLASIIKQNNYHKGINLMWDHLLVSIQPC
jgi:hypothetical protein